MYEYTIEYSEHEKKIIENIINIFKKYYKENEVDIKTITKNTHLLYDLNFDSLDRFQFMLYIEDGFNISIPDEEISKIGTIDDIVQVLKRQKVRV